MNAILLVLLAVPTPKAPLPPQAPPVREMTTATKNAAPKKSGPCPSQCECGCHEGQTCTCGAKAAPYVAPNAAMPGGARFAPGVIYRPVTPFRSSSGGFRRGGGSCSS